MSLENDYKEYGNSAGVETNKHAGKVVVRDDANIREIDGEECIVLPGDKFTNEHAGNCIVSTVDNDGEIDKLEKRKLMLIERFKNSEKKLIMGIVIKENLFIPILRDFKSTGYDSVDQLNEDIEKFNGSFSDKTIKAIVVEVPKQAEIFSSIITTLKCKVCSIDGVDINGFFIKKTFKEFLLN